MVEQQSRLVLQRTRRLFIRQQIAIINSIRAHLAEFGIGGRAGRHGIENRFSIPMTPGLLQSNI
jgi:transposase